MLLTSLASEYREEVLSFVWRQWAQLGLNAPTTQHDRWCQDPEALLVFSLEVARQEPRMFDEILDWLAQNEAEIMMHRLKTLLALDAEIPSAIINAAFECTTAKKVDSPLTLAHPPEPLFPMFDDVSGWPAETDPVFRAHGYLRPPFSRSKKSRPIRRAYPAAFAFKLRAAFGASTRSEALRYLLLRREHKFGTTEIAEAALLSRFGVQQALEGLAEAGLIHKGAKGKKDLIWWLEDPSQMRWLYSSDGNLPEWVGWPSVYRGLALLWRWLLAPERGQESPYILASGAKGAMRQATPLLVHQGLRWHPRDLHDSQGTAYLETFAHDIQALALALNGESKPDRVIQTVKQSGQPLPHKAPGPRRVVREQP
jgi:hypothetical protein